MTTLHITCTGCGALVGNWQQHLRWHEQHGHAHEERPGRHVDLTEHDDQPEPDPGTCITNPGSGRHCWYVLGQHTPIYGSGNAYAEGCCWCGTGNDEHVEPQCNDRDGCDGNGHVGPPGQPGRQPGRLRPRRPGSGGRAVE